MQSRWIGALPIEQVSLGLVWPDGQTVFSIFGHLQQWIFAHEHTSCAKVGSQLCLVPNEPWEYCQYFYIFAKVAKFCQIWSHWLGHSLRAVVEQLDFSKIDISFWPIFCKTSYLGTVWPDLATLGNFSKPLAAINLPKSPTFIGNFCKGVKIFNFSNEVIFGELL